MTVVNKLSVELSTLEKLLKKFEKNLKDNDQLTAADIYKFSNQREMLLKKISTLFDNVQEVHIDNQMLQTPLELSERIDGLTNNIVEKCLTEQGNIKLQLNKLRKGKVALKGYSSGKKKSSKRLNLSG